ncbi:MAG: sulfatase-like hydrolase/transferase, partial [Verrucomicrobiae bacterium]|nr:sulfatase-like hydrolase/transferase [Verrucomicrobiae bacterium]NNJ85956.1 sulfatase-like hydrolase/transferase [Akkermansiaceae bacterium]
GETTFAQLLKKRGYATAIAGKWQLGREKDAPKHFGFDESLLWQHTRSGRSKLKGKTIDRRFENPYLERNGVEEEYTNGEFGPDLCTDFICDFMSRKKDQPFLVYYPMILTHCPWGPVPGSKGWDPKRLGSPTYKGQPKYFGTMASHMDQLVGRIVKHVKAEGLENRTIILFTGDNGTDKPIVSDCHGVPVAGGKGLTLDTGTHVPFVAYAPGRIAAGVNKDLIDFTDFLPTLCELAGVELDEKSGKFDGRSFAPALAGKSWVSRDHVFCWYSRSGKYARDLKVFARSHRYKLYRNGKFFDLKNDPLENHAIKPDSLTKKQQAVWQKLEAVIAKRKQLSGR